MNNLYSRDSLSTLSKSVEGEIGEDHELAQLYITAEDIDDELKPESIPTRGLLLCIENQYLRKYVYGGKTSLHTPGQRTRRRS